MADRQTARAAAAEAVTGDGTPTTPRPPSDLRILTVRCGECRATVDRVEYDANWSEDVVVAAAASALGTDAKKARKILADTNPDALRSHEDRAADLVGQIVAGNVPDRHADTYACPNGHTGSLEIER